VNQVRHEDPGSEEFLGLGVKGSVESSFWSSTWGVRFMEMANPKGSWCKER
jgi:hypothetical protein